MRNLGLMILFLGLSMGDSENLLIPAAVLAVGAVLYLIGNKKAVDK